MPFPRNWGLSAIPAALGLVHVLAGNRVDVTPGVVVQDAELGGHGRLHVLAVAVHQGIQGRRGQNCLAGSW